MKRSVHLQHAEKFDGLSSVASTSLSNSAIGVNSQFSNAKHSLKSSAATILGTLSGTAALVGIHHYYRKQRQPDARLQDYLTGVKAQFKPLSNLSIFSTQSISHLGFSLQPSTQANIAPDFSALHTTVIMSRPVCWVSGVSSMPKPTTLATSADMHKDKRCFGVVGIDAERQLVWQTTMPERIHDIVIQPKLDDTLAINPSRHVVVMGRRPSEKFWVVDTATGQVRYAINANPERHFYGHACYSLNGKKLYVTENNTANLTGKIGIYDVESHYQKIAEFDAYGIGPHELIMHPDGETLVIANGGIKTEQASREELNLDTMRPSLVYLNRHTGKLLEQVLPEHNQMSIRHLAMHDNGTVMIGIQFQGEKHLNVPLVLTHQRGDLEFTPLIMPNNQWQRFHHYIASVAVDSENNLLCVTTPIGGCAAVYDLNTYELVDSVTLLDCAGVSVVISKDKGKSRDSHACFVVSDGQGQLTTLSVDKQNKNLTIDSQYHNMAFDNHLQAL